MGMSIDAFSKEAKEHMIDMVHFIDMKQKNPNYISPSKMWLPTTFKLEVPKDRYLDIDGFGEELLPYPELDQWLKQNEKTDLEIKSVKTSSNKRLYISIVVMIIFILVYFYK